MRRCGARGPLNRACAIRTDEPRSSPFGASDDAYLFDADVLDLPFRESAPELSEELEGLASLLLARLDGSHRFLDRLERALDEESLDGRATAERVARRLAMTARTLHRRLAKEGLTFRRFRERLLRARAERLLSDSDATLQEISFLLGYADPPGFSRAFRRWTGTAPGAWRESRATSRAASAHPRSRRDAVRTGAARAAP